MRFCLSKTRNAAIILFILGLSACASNTPQDIASDFAKQRAEMLDKIVPVNMNGYNLIRAKSMANQIELTLLFSGQEGVITPDTLANNLTQAYCGDNEITSLMDKGVVYKFLFRDARGRLVSEREVNSMSCL